MILSGRKLIAEIDRRIVRVASYFPLEASLLFRAYTMKQVVDAADSRSKSRAGRVSSSIRDFDVKSGRATFASRGETGSYVQEISFEDWDAILEVLEGEDILDQLATMAPGTIIRHPDIKDLLKESAVKVVCYCPAYTYYFAYISHTLGFGELGDAIAKAPNVRNPDYEGTVCKHLIAVYNEFLR